VPRLCPFPKLFPVTVVTLVTVLCRGLRCRAADEQLMKLEGKLVRDLRLAKILHQEDMCQFEFEYKYYQRIEYGQKNLSIKTLKKLAKAFRISVSGLLDID
jgi:hypothetical protein